MDLAGLEGGEGVVVEADGEGGEEVVGTGEGQVVDQNLARHKTILLSAPVTIISLFLLNQISFLHVSVRRYIML